MLFPLKLGFSTAASLDRVVAEPQLNVVKCLFCISWDNHVFLFQFFKMINIPLIDFLILSQPCVSEINPTWLWCVILLIYCLIWFAKILFRIFASMFMRDISLEFSLIVKSLPDFGIVMPASWNELKRISSSFFEQNYYYFFIKCLENFTLKPYKLEIFLWEGY